MFTPKHRRKVFLEEKRLEVREILRQLCQWKGGHLSGEIVFIDYQNLVAMTGDIYINTYGLTSEQAQYNQYTLF